MKLKSELIGRYTYVLGISLSTFLNLKPNFYFKIYILLNYILKKTYKL